MTTALVDGKRLASDLLDSLPVLSPMVNENLALGEWELAIFEGLATLNAANSPLSPELRARVEQLIDHGQIWNKYADLIRDELLKVSSA